LAVVDGKGELRLWDTRTGISNAMRVFRRMFPKDDPEPVQGVARLPDGKMLLIGLEDGLTLVNAQTLQSGSVMGLRVSAHILKTSGTYDDAVTVLSPSGAILSVNLLKTEVSRPPYEGEWLGGPLSASLNRSRILGVGIGGSQDQVGSAERDRPGSAKTI